MTAGLLGDDQDQADTDEDGQAPDKHRYLYVMVRRDDRDLDTLTDRIMRSVAARQRARLALRAVRDGPPNVPATAPATAPPSPPAARAA